jgi:hypothetical protein
MTVSPIRRQSLDQCACSGHDHTSPDFVMAFRVGRHFMPRPFATRIVRAAEVRRQLQILTGAGSTPPALVLRGRILLGTAVAGPPTSSSRSNAIATGTPSANGGNASLPKGWPAARMPHAPVDPGAFPPDERLHVVHLATSKTADHDQPATRWSLDDRGFAGGDANLHRYVRNNPTNAVDPLGMMGWMANGTATGFRFGPYSAAAFLAAAQRALDLYRREPDEWLALQRHGMGQDWSWNRSAAAYEQVYAGLAGG